MRELDGVIVFEEQDLRKMVEPILDDFHKIRDGMLARDYPMPFKMRLPLLQRLYGVDNIEGQE